MMALLFKKHKNGVQGFTVIEMLAATSVLMLISGMLLYSLNQIARTTARSIGKSDSYQATRVVLDQMSRELQQATPYTAIISPGNTNNIFLVSGTALKFIAVLDNDQGQEEAEVHYVYDGDDKLYKGIVLYTNMPSSPWDFTTQANWDTSPAINTSTNKILEGVRSMSVRVWPSSTINNYPDLGISNSVWSSKGSEIPAYVEVKLEVYDANVIKRWQRASLVEGDDRYLYRTFKIFVQLPRSYENQ